MPRHKRSDRINDFHLTQIERQVALLRSVLDAATLSLTPFHPHYDAIAELETALRRVLNVLNDRPADWEEPYRVPFAGADG